MSFVNQITAELAEFLAANGVEMRSRQECSLPPVTKAGYPVPLVSPTEVYTHHTAGNDGGGTVAGEIQAWQQVADLHFGKGWSQEAYNVAVGLTGTAYEGRGIGFQPGGTGWPWDGRSHSVVLLGYFHPPYNDQVTPEMERTARLIHTFLEDRGLGGDNSLGHYQANPTACPGVTVYPHLPWRRVDASTPQPELPLYPPLPDLVDNLRFWMPPASRSLRYNPGNLMAGNDVAEFQFHANLTVADPNTPGMSKWTTVDGIFGKDSDRLARLTQEYGEYFGYIDSGVDGIAGQDTRHFVVVTMNNKGYW